MEYMEQKMDELIEAGLHMEAEMKPKTGRYVFEIKIPVTVLYSKRDDNTISIDSVSVPSEDDIYIIVDKHAKAIKAGAEVRARDAADGEKQGSANQSPPAIALKNSGQETLSAYELPCYGCGSTAGICNCSNR